MTARHRHPVRAADRPAPAECGCLALGPWLLAPEGGLIHPAERAAVIADVHLGYEWARGAAGDCVPAHSLEETRRQLELLLERPPGDVQRLIVAGDLVEPTRPCRRAAAAVAGLLRWLEGRGVRLVLLRGNHDRGLDWLIRHDRAGFPAAAIDVQDDLVLDDWRIVHGHGRRPGGKLVVGHHHPVMKASGRSFRCFLAGPRRIMLPAFSGNAAGLDVATLRLAGGAGTGRLRCIASSGGELFDFGPVRYLASRLR
jgi:putative SbcD/Mre11-related phosphoesterase